MIHGRSVPSLDGPVVLESEIVCPKCGRSEPGTMPPDASPQSYGCKGCGARLEPKDGDCCVYCSYGTVPCPVVQTRIRQLLHNVFD